MGTCKMTSKTLSKKGQESHFSLFTMTMGGVEEGYINYIYYILVNQAKSGSMLKNFLFMLDMNLPDSMDIHAALRLGVLHVFRTCPRFPLWIYVYIYI